MRAIWTCPLLVAAISIGTGCGDDSGGGDGATTIPMTAGSTGGTDEASGTGVGGPYPRCEAATSCFFAMYDTCISPADGAADGFCTRACTAGSDCPIPDGGEAAPACEDLNGNGPACYLDCSGGSTCPQGMVCKLVVVAAGQRTLCFWSP